MRTIDDYMAMPYSMEIVEDKTDGGYAVCFPDLPGCITCGETMEEAIENAKDAKRAWLEAAIEDGVRIKEPEMPGNGSSQIKVQVPQSLRLSLMKHAGKEGVSLEQYCLYLLSNRDAGYKKEKGQEGGRKRRGKPQRKEIDGGRKNVCPSKDLTGPRQSTDARDVGLNGDART